MTKPATIVMTKTGEYFSRNVENVFLVIQEIEPGHYSILPKYAAVRFTPNWSESPAKWEMTIKERPQWWIDRRDVKRARECLKKWYETKVVGPGCCFKVDTVVGRQIFVMSGASPLWITCAGSNINLVRPGRYCILNLENSTVCIPECADTAGEYEINCTDVGSLVIDACGVSASIRMNGLFSLSAAARCRLVVRTEPNSAGVIDAPGCSIEVCGGRNSTIAINKAKSVTEKSGKVVMLRHGGTKR